MIVLRTAADMRLLGELQNAVVATRTPRT